MLKRLNYYPLQVMALSWHMIESIMPFQRCFLFEGNQLVNLRKIMAREYLEKGKLARMSIYFSGIHLFIEGMGFFLQSHNGKKKILILFNIIKE